MTFQVSTPTTSEELLDEVQDKVSIGMLKLSRDNDPLIVNVLNHLQLFGQSAITSPEDTITQAMANLGVSQMKTISKFAGMNNHPNTVKVLARVFFEALDIPVLLYA